MTRLDLHDIVVEALYILAHVYPALGYTGTVVLLLVPYILSPPFRAT